MKGFYLFILEPSAICGLAPTDLADKLVVYDVYAIAQRHYIMKLEHPRKLGAAPIQSLDSGVWAATRSLGTTVA